MGCIYSSETEKKQLSSMVSPNVNGMKPQPIEKQKSDQLKIQNKVDQNLLIPKKKKKIRETVRAIKKLDTEGHKMINDYVICEFLGQGAFGKVKLGIRKINDIECQFALKILKKSQLRRKREYYKDTNGVMKIKDALQDVKREIAVMKKISHPNLVSLHEVIDNPDNDKIIMVLDYAKDGQLIEWDEEEEKFFYVSQIEEDLSEDFLKRVFRDCIKGMHYLHFNGIVHRDLKPQNILMSDGKAMIADFGVSLITGEIDLLDNTQGTYHFMPPEACSVDQVKKGYQGKPADVWGLGVTFFCFVYLVVPFNGSSLPDMLASISQAKVIFPQSRATSRGMQSFLNSMLQKDVNLRPTIRQLAQDEWLNQGHKSLLEEITAQETLLDQVSSEEINNAYSLSTIIRIKNWVTQWRRKASLLKNAEVSKTKITMDEERLVDGDPNDEKKQKDQL